MPKPTWSTQVGLAKETTYGTAVAPTNFLPVTGVKVDDKLTYVEDKGWRGAPVEVYAQYAGPAVSDISWDGPVYADTIGVLLRSMLGIDDVTGSASPYTHRFTLDNQAQPPSLTVTDAVSGSMRQAAGVQLEELSFKFDPQQLFTYSLKGQGLMTTSLSTRPSASYSAIKGSLGWSFQPKINGTAVSTVESLELTITRKLTPIYTLASQSPYAVYGGFLGVAGKFTAVMEDETLLTSYLQSTLQTLELNMSSTSGVVNGAPGGASGGTTGTSLDFMMDSVSFKSAVKNRSKDYVEIDVDFTALANTTDASTKQTPAGYSPIAITLTNSIASY